MSNDTSTCKRGCITDGNETKKRRLGQNEESVDSTTPDGTEALPDDTVTTPENTVTAPESTVNAPKSTVTVSKNAVTAPEDAVTGPKGTVSDQVKPNATEQQAKDRVRRKKVVLLLSYSGWGYLGMQRNPGAKTIEDDLLQALFKAGLINEECLNQPQQMLFQRAARTDKGVSAVRQVVSVKLPEDSNIELINEHLPDQIRVVCMKRTTKGFNAKTACDARTYSYLLPTFAFSPEGQEPAPTFRITTDILTNVNNILKKFTGTHNFYNFTSKRGFADPSSNRYIMSFTCGKPFLKGNCEYVFLTVKGQSFMQHHIRKMIGLTIAIARGYTTTDTIERAFKSEPLDLPKAPGLGLMLEEVHYDWYNNKYGKDGVHEALEWSKYEDTIQEFKDRHVISTIVKTETEEKSMLTWMATLSGHSYSLREDRPPTVVKSNEESKKNEITGTNPSEGNTQNGQDQEKIVTSQGAQSESQNGDQVETKEELSG